MANICTTQQPRRVDLRVEHGNRTIRTTLIHPVHISQGLVCRLGEFRNLLTCKDDMNLPILMARAIIFVDSRKHRRDEGAGLEHLSSN